MSGSPAPRNIASRSFWSAVVLGHGRFGARRLRGRLHRPAGRRTTRSRTAPATEARWGVDAPAEPVAEAPGAARAAASWRRG